ncbi:MAG TPA: class I SAM-dependent methyltransferase [Verrucomicrobiae bacterium]|nr:class I SAM-dependent methyltransferase [Verrucomicrobiae bacterium]
MKKKYICPICSSDNISNYLKSSNQHGKKLLQIKKKFNYYRCNNCDVTFLSGIAIDKTYYQTYYSFPESENNVPKFKKIENKFAEYSNNFKKGIIEQFVNNKKKIDLLDIGCGTGNFIASLDKSKYNAVGIERDKTEYQIAKEKNITVYCSDILRQNFEDRKFDVITLWHVVEHIPEPHKLLKKIRKLLKKDGIVILTTPNSDALGFKIAKEKWFHLDAPRHIILYSKKGMKILGSKNDFKLIKTFSQTFEFPLDLFWSLKQSKKKYFMYPLYPLMKYYSKETLTYVLTKSFEK